MKPLYHFFFTWVLLLPVFAFAQLPGLTPKTTTSTADDTLITVEILPGVRKLEMRKVNDSTQLQILAGKGSILCIHKPVKRMSGHA